MKTSSRVSSGFIPTDAVRIAVATLGCKVNQYESAGIAERLTEKGFFLVPFNETADVYIINTCTVTARTDYQSRQLIRRAARKNPAASIVVTGCYAQLAAAKLADLPGVSLVAGNTEKEFIPDLISRLPKQKPLMKVGKIEDQTEISPLAPSCFPGHTRSFLKIQDGCNAFCTYCVVPYARGRSRSLSPSFVLERISRLEKAGYREIVLTGIHLGAYGQDLTPPTSLPVLLEKLEAVATKSARIRLSSVEPREVTGELLRMLKHSKTFCRHLHIPLQSGDDGILGLMRRNYDSRFFKDLINKIVGEIPDIAIGIDVMTGFPGEGEGEFQNTFRLLEDLPAAYLHVFPYSERSQTVAAAYSGKVPDIEKAKRSEALRRLDQVKRAKFRERFIGKKLAVLLEDRKDKETGFLKGFSDNYISIVVPDASSVSVNCVVEVLVEKTADGRTIGRIAHGS